MPYEPMTVVVLQGTGQAQGGAVQAPPPPPIPALPAEPGAATGGAPGTGRIVFNSEEFGNQIRNQIRDQITGTQAPRNNDIPPEVIPLVGMTLGILMSVIILFPIARAIGRMIDRRTDRSLVKVAEVAPQLRLLQESVDAMAIELERISEAQRFTARIMAEKSPEALPRG